MKKSPVEVLKEDEITSAAEGSLQFGDNNLRGGNEKWCKAHMARESIKHEACLGVPYYCSPSHPLETKWSEVPF